MESRDVRAVIRSLIIEVVAYGLLVVAYSWVVLRWLREPLSELFRTNLLVYALLTLALIVVQGAFLDVITAFLLAQLPIERLE